MNTAKELDRLADELQSELFIELDERFPKNKSERRGKAMVLIAMSIIKAQKLLKKAHKLGVKGERRRIKKIISRMETWHYTNVSPLIFREDLLRDINQLSNEGV